MLMVYDMKKMMLVCAAMVTLAGMTACRQNANNQTKDNMNQELTLTQEWDKVFPLSEKVNHRKVTFETQYGLTLAADLYTPAGGEKLKVKSIRLSPSAVLSAP